MQTRHEGAEGSGGAGAAWEAQSILAAVVGSIQDAISVLDDEWRFLRLNPAAERMLGVREGDVLGQVVWDRFPTMRDSPTYEAALAAVESGGQHDLLWYHPVRKAWYAQQVTSSGDYLVFVSREVTAQHLAELRNRLLLEISEGLNAVETPEEAGDVIITSALPITGAIAGGVLLREHAAPYLRGLRWSGITQEIMNDFVRYPLDTASPGAEAVRSGAIVWAPAERAVKRWPAIEKALAQTGAKTVVGIPLAVLGDPLGALVIHLATDAPLNDATSEFLRTVAAMCAQTISRTQRRVAEHEVALALQRSLLPAVPTRIREIEVRVDYLPGDPGVDIGGDWYDVIDTAAGLILVVGDVEGHDADAAAVMAQLRSAVRACALDGHGPSALIERLERFMTTTQTRKRASVLIVQLTGERTAVASSAGHLPPLVRGDSANWNALNVSGGPLLGLSPFPSRWRESELLLPTNWSLLMFTDGLVESRRDDIDTGVSRLCQRLSALTAGSNPDAIVEAALDAAPEGQRQDDIAILVAQHARST